MLAYDYLKSNPQKNGKRINKWTELFIDPETPYGVKQELIALSKITELTTDAVLYFHGVYSIAKLTATPVDGWFLDGFKSKKWSDTLYTLIQKEELLTNATCKLFFAFDKDQIAVAETLSIDEIRNIILTYDKYNRIYSDQVNFNQLLFTALRNENDYRAIRNSDTALITQIFMFMSIDFIRKADLNTIRKCSDLFRDVPFPQVNKYGSLRELEQVHDARTEEEVKRLLKDKPAKIIYHPVFKELVEKYGFTLPKTKNDMIERGAKHHNCVATYADRHITNYSTNTYCKLIFAPDATAELNIEVIHSKVAAVLVPQYKGRYNKNIDQPPELTDLRIALTGQPADVIYVREETNNDKS